jgi:hypothetical protein
MVAAPRWLPHTRRSLTWRIKVTLLKLHPTSLHVDGIRPACEPCQVACACRAAPHSRGGNGVELQLLPRGLCCCPFALPRPATTTTTAAAGCCNASGRRCHHNLQLPWRRLACTTTHTDGCSSSTSIYRFSAAAVANLAGRPCNQLAWAVSCKATRSRTNFIVGRAVIR